MGLIASPNNSFIMRHAPSEHVGSIGGMIALTRNLGMLIGASLALGVIIMLICNVYFDNRRNLIAKKNDENKQHMLNNQKSL